MKIYILCPPKFFTGGPLGLHQLCKELNSLGLPSFIYYPRSLFSAFNNPVHDNYKHFDNPYVRSVPDEPGNVLIVPEIFTEHFAGFRKIKKVVWWLSIDNYFVYEKSFNSSFIGKCKSIIGLNPLSITEIKESVDLNLGQSEYAMDFIRFNSLKNPFKLNDFIPEEFFKEVCLDSKENIVLYNPKKGIDFTKQLIQENPNIDFIPLVNLKPFEVVSLLKKSKLYIDFGEHPGRDRFPREASILGNVIVTGRDGSADNEVDINIPLMYKFKKSDSSIVAISDLIVEILSDFRFHLDSQNMYTSTVQKGESIFKGQVKDLLKLLNRL